MHKKRRHSEIQNEKNDFLFCYFSRLHYLCTQHKKKIVKMKKTLFKTIVAGAAVLALTACNKEKFHITGNITEAKDSMLYFENISLDGPVAVDSVKLGEDGHFDFSDSRPEAPEFYRLRIANQFVSLSVDSTETITIKAQYPTMSTGYTVEGSENCETIKTLSLKNIALFNSIVAIQQNPQLGLEATNDSIRKTVEAYKQDIKQNYIFKAPMKSSSYFALFQTLGNMLIFNPRENKDDIKAFAAVATSWDTFYPNSLRKENLHNITMEGMKNIRIIESKYNMQIDPSKVNTSGVLDIELINNKGQVSKLSDLKGKVVLLDFHAFASEESTARIMKLREVYNKYHAQGFEIYQVSVDPNEHFWKQQTEALPWVSVRDPEGIDSKLMQTFNVQSFPTFFTVGRDNLLHKRDAQIKDLDVEIQSLL